MRMVMRITYEMVCAIENFFADIVQKICGCEPKDGYFFFKSNKNIKIKSSSILFENKGVVLQ